ncbi:MAG: helix-turn-helix domain-containing protein, partial [OM182 bacterium]|nr:helix-turn-helix domain-containing protein [OM182 bacterium]
HYLRAIEENAYDKLPGVVFARGYVRNYCVLLEMPTEPLMTMFEALVEAARKEKEAEGVPKRKLTRVDRNQRWLSLSLLVFVSLFGVLWFLNG